MGWANSGDVKTIFLQGVIPLFLGFTLLILAALYCLGILKFKCCTRRNVVPVMVSDDNAAGTSTDGPTTMAAAEQVYGPVACQAQLFGMEAKERQTVLESVFASFCSTHQRQKDKKKDEQEEDDHNKDSSERSDSSGEMHGLDTRCACAICLREYEDGEEVMTGTQCDHLFHKNCAMVWLSHHRKPKDHCPYCRGEMLTATEMKKAALELLGADRVAELAQFPPPARNNNSGRNVDNSNHSSVYNINITETVISTNGQAATEVPADIESGL